MYKLKSEFKDFYTSNKVLIKEYEQIFFNNEHAYLRGRMPVSWKIKIDKMWYQCPLSKIQDGFHNNGLMDAELENLKHDSFCKRNTNKEYWLKSYMMAWMNLPDTLTDEYLFNHLDSRRAFILMLKNAYNKV